MVNINALLSEWAYRCKKGYPDLDSPSDLRVLKTILKEQNITLPEQQLSLFSDEELERLTIKIKKGEEDIENLNKDEIFALLDANKEDKEFVSMIKKKLKAQPKRKDFNKVCLKANIDETTIEDTDTPGKLFDILVANDDVDNFDDYVKKGQLSLNQLKSDGVRNLIKDLSQTGISSESITKLVNYGGFEGGRGVGKAEIALALLLKDVVMRRPEKGDLTWDGKYLEVKGTSGRLGGRDQKLTGAPKILDLVKKYPDISSKVRPDLFIPDLISNGEEEENILPLAKELAKTMYPEAININDVITEDILTEPIPLRIAYQKIYVSNYVNGEGVEDFIFVDTSNRFGNYLLKSPEELISYIDKNFTKFCGPVSLKNISPTTFSNGI